MRFKYLFVFFFLTGLSSCFCQDLVGTYTSKKGSILELRKDNSYVYTKQLVISHLVERQLLSSGKFEVKDKVLILKNEIEKDRTDKVIIKELNTNSKKRDSIELNLQSNTNQVKIFICDTNLELSKNNNDYSGCFPLKTGINKVSKVYSEKFHFKIFPNIEDYSFRMNFDNINRLYYRSREFSKKLNSDLDINIDFDTQNFLNSSFEEEFAIINGKTIRFLGEDLVLVK